MPPRDTVVTRYVPALAPSYEWDKLECTVHGAFGVTLKTYRGWWGNDDKADLYIVLHLVTGLMVIGFADRGDCLLAVRMLNERARPTFNWNTKDEVLAATPEWLLVWYGACKELGCYVEPDEED